MSGHGRKVSLRAQIAGLHARVHDLEKAVAGQHQLLRVLIALVEGRLPAPPKGVDDGA